MLVYRAVAAAVVWLGAVPWTLARAARGHLRPGELGERLGRVTPPSGPRRPLIVHGVSAGEMASARALVDALVRRDTGVRIVLTTGTPDGRAIADRWREEVPQVVATQFLPWDRPAAVRHWLAGLNPAAVVVVETELWPGLFAACRAHQIPVYIVSGRLYPRDVRRYRWLGRWWSSVMAMPTRVLTQDAAEAEAFMAIGTPPHLVEVGGSLKFDATRPTPDRRTGAQLTVVAGSTHAPEEGWILAAVARVRHAGIPCVLTLAPRDIRRAASIRRQAETLGLTAVTVLDRMGTLPATYASAHIALCGGTFAPRGGHNIVEPAAAGCAIVAGPHVAHIRRLVAQLEAAGGAVRVPASADPVAAIAEALIELHGDRERLALIGQRAAAWCVEGRGAAERAAAVIDGGPPI